jgi:F0F1-type ATP synthase epsilon subunit
VLKIITLIGIMLERKMAFGLSLVADGEVEILPRNLFLLTIIESGVPAAKHSNSHELFARDFGFAMIFRDIVFVLPDESPDCDHADSAENEESDEFAQKVLEDLLLCKNSEILDPVEIEKLHPNVKY